MPRAIKVFILDDHDDVRRALVVRLCSVPGVLVVGEAAEAEAGLLEISSLRPDVVFVETKRADGRGLELLNWLTHSGLGARVVVLTSYSTEWEKWAVHQAGAAAYLLKDISSSELLQEIHGTVARLQGA